MANVTTQSVVRQIESLFDGGGVDCGLSDQQLVDRFVMRRDAAGEDAFAALVARHGPMVLRVCKRASGQLQHDSEDAFQAVFLVLARTGPIPFAIRTCFELALRDCASHRARREPVWPGSRGAEEDRRHELIRKHAQR